MFWIESIFSFAARAARGNTKYYVDVVINFHGTDYDKYTVNVYKDE